MNGEHQFDARRDARERRRQNPGVEILSEQALGDERGEKAKLFGAHDDRFREREGVRNIILVCSASAWRPDAQLH